MKLNLSGFIDVVVQGVSQLSLILYSIDYSKKKNMLKPLCTLNYKTHRAKNVLDAYHKVFLFYF